jgi:micrococcal nuclease
VEAFGIEARQANRSLVEGKEVRLEMDVSETDKYGRLLRYVYVDEVLVNAELVKQGLARARAYPPDTKYQDYLAEMEEDARDAGRGMWVK